METKPLELIGPLRGPGGGARRSLVLGVFSVILISAGIATLLGADLARNEIDARELAEATLREAIARGSSEPSVRARLIDLRGVVCNRPLDSKTRVAYSSLMLGLSRRLEDLEVAAFHARRAAEFAPVTLPVVRPAALVLANTGYPEEALAITRTVFDYDQSAAAEILVNLETRVSEPDLERGIPDAPEAWLAWSIRLESLGRLDEASDRLRASSRRWPDHLGVLARRADLAVRNKDWQTLLELFPPDRELPDERAYAVPILCAGRLRAHEGNRLQARQHIERALELDPDSRFVQLRAAEGYESIGDFAKARDYWNRALFTLPQTESHRVLRITILRDLARLEDAHGQPAAALRLWRSLLELRPEHAEAQERVDDLTGFKR